MRSFVRSNKRRRAGEPHSPVAFTHKQAAPSEYARCLKILDHIKTQREKLLDEKRAQHAESKKPEPPSATVEERISYWAEKFLATDPQEFLR